MKVTKLATIRGTTNEGIPAKQTIKILDDGYQEPAILITKLVLVNNQSEYNNYKSTGHYGLKEFKGKLLMRKTFALKVSTFKEIAKHLYKFELSQNKRYEKIQFSKL